MMIKIGFYTLLFFWTTLLSLSSAARILGVFHIDGRSHFNFHETLMKILLAAGHQVTAVAPMSSKFSHENYTIINYRNTSNNREHPWAFMTRQKLTSSSLHLQGLNEYESNCREILKLEEHINVTGNFDIMFVEMMPLFQCFLPLAKKSKIPVIGTMTMLSFMGPDLHLGNPRNPSILPAMSSVVHTKMSFYERIENIVEEMKMKIFYAYCEYIKKQYKVKLFNELFSDQDLFDYGVSLLFINNHESILPTAQMTNTINIGGINIKSAQLQPLPEPLKIFIEGAENGVILFSLGSVTTADSIEPEVLAALIRTFAKIPERVLWKFSGKIDGLSENVLLVDWLPQKEILAHENVKAFISHVGIASMYEAIYFGKPMILMPVCADQPGNAGLLMSLGVGEYLNFVKVTETELLEALNEVVNGSKCRENMRKLSLIFKDEPISPSEKVLFWTEYVLRHNGTTHLRSLAVDMPMYQYLLLDDEPVSPTEKVLFWTEYVLRHNGTAHLKSVALYKTIYQYLLFDIILMVISAVTIISGFLIYSLKRPFITQ